MSQTDLLTAPAPAISDAPPPALARRRAGAAPWGRVALACALLGVAGGARLWQQGRIARGLEADAAEPFPLREVPMRLGPWEGTDVKLDPRIAREAAAVDHIQRRYVDRRTGAQVHLIVIYGAPGEITLHPPEVCYPYIGFTQAGAAGRAVRVGDRDVPFRSVVFTRPSAAGADREEVYYTWGTAGRWGPDPPVHKVLERMGGMYKVQLQRQVGPAEDPSAAGDEDPCESLLAHLMPELEGRMAPSR